MNIVHKPTLSNNLVRLLLQTTAFLTRNKLIDRNLKRGKKVPLPPRDFTTSTYHDIPVYSMETTSDHHLIFLHGGAFKFGIESIHYGFARDLAKQGNVNVHLIDYPLLPKGTVSVTLPQTIAVINDLIQDKNIAHYDFLGDSAGAGLALSITSKKPILAPQKLFLLSPWVDVSTTNEGAYYLIKQDPILSIRGLQYLGKQYAENNVHDPNPSPLYQETAITQPIYIYAGTHDILLPDILKYEYIHTEVELHVFHKGVHDCSLIPYTSAKKDTLQDIVSHL